MAYSVANATMCRNISAAFLATLETDDSNCSTSAVMPVQALEVLQGVVAATDGRVGAIADSPVVTSVPSDLLSRTSAPSKCEVHVASRNKSSSLLLH